MSQTASTGSRQTRSVTRLVGAVITHGSIRQAQAGRYQQRSPRSPGVVLPDVGHISRELLRPYEQQPSTAASGTSSGSSIRQSRHAVAPSPLPRSHPGGQPPAFEAYEALRQRHGGSHLRGPPLREARGEQIEIPGIGSFSLRQLRNLEAVLNSGETGSNEDVPDLSRLSATQLETLEAVLGTGGLDRLIAMGSRSEGTANLTSPHSEAPSSSSASSSSRASTTESGLQQRWKVKEEAFSQFSVSADSLPADQECSICCQQIQDYAVALPCRSRGCRSFFHGDCIHPWLERKPSCPLCRMSLQELVVRQTEHLSHDSACPLFELWLQGLFEDPWNTPIRSVPFGQGAGHSPSSQASSLAGLRDMVLPVWALTQLVRAHGPGATGRRQSSSLSRVSGQETSAASRPFGIRAVGAASAALWSAATSSPWQQQSHALRTEGPGQLLRRAAQRTLLDPLPSAALPSSSVASHLRLLRRRPSLPLSGREHEEAAIGVQRSIGFTPDGVSNVFSSSALGGRASSMPQLPGPS